MRLPASRIGAIRNSLLEAGPRVAVPWLAATLPAQARSEGEDTPFAGFRALTRALLEVWPPPRREDRWQAPDTLRAQMLTMLNALREPAPLLAFLDLLLIPGNYNGTEDSPLLRALEIADAASPGYPTTFLPTFIEAQVARALPACVCFLRQILDHPAEPLRAGLPDAISALVQGLPTPDKHMLSFARDLDGLPETPGDSHVDSLRSLSRRGGGPSAETLAALLALLAEAQAGEAMARATRHILGHAKAYPMDVSVIPSLILRVEAGDDLKAAATLVAAARAYLAKRTALPLAAPPDWRREATLKCRCADCKAAAAFLADPTRSSWTLKARKDLRAHVEGHLKRAGSDVDCQTVRKGSPHELHCVKNQRSYERRVAQRAQDLRYLKALGGGAQGERGEVSA